MKYIEKAGTGTVDMIRLCRKHGLKEPQFRLESESFVLTIYRNESDALKINVSDNVGVEDHVKSGTTQSPTQSPTQSIDPVVRLLTVLESRELSSGALREILQIKHRPTFRQNYLHPALAEKLIEFTIPDKPNSRLQKYRLTKKGIARAKNGRSKG